MVNKNYILSSEIINKFNLDVIVNKNSKPNKIKHISIIRAGLELAGIFIYSRIWSIIYLGAKENEYLTQISKQEVIEKLHKLFQAKPPLIILGKNFFFIEEFKSVGKEYNDVPIVWIDANYNYITNTITNYLTETLALFEVIHGTLLEIYGIGVLIIGKSGVGKSELAIDLIKKGHIFVADDAVEVSQIGNNVIGRSPKLTSGFIEIRGLGILDFYKTFGYHKSISSTRIKIVIEIFEPETKNYNEIERIGRSKFYTLKNVKLNYYRIPILPGRRISEIIETAIADYKLRKKGFSSEKELLKKLKSKKEVGDHE